MPNDDVRAPSKAAQEAEATARANSGVIAAKETVPGDVADLSAPEHEAVVVTPKVETKPVRPQREEPQKLSREDIAANFRKNRAEREAADKLDADAEYRELVGQGLPPEFDDQVDHTVVEEDEETPVVAAEEDEPVVPAKKKPPAPVEEEKPLFVIKVRGKEKHVTEDELFELAQKAAAGDDYLGEARTTLDDAKRLKTEIEAQRGSQPTKHPGQQTNTQTTEQDQTKLGNLEHPEDPFEQLVEAIQFGTKEDAAKKVQEVIASTVSKQTADTNFAQRQQQEVQRGVRASEAFSKANPELATDGLAKAAIISRCLELQRQDLLSIPGMDPDKVPTSPQEIQQWHVFYRARGDYDLREPSAIINTAKDDFEQWRGGSPKPAAKTDTKPRIEISADRRVRRSAVQQQPTRAVAPRPDPVQLKPAVEDSRSAAVQRMMQSRNLPRALGARPQRGTAQA